MRELILKKCERCGAVIKVIENKTGTIFCCGEKMKDIVANSVDASTEKHVPNYEVTDHGIEVFVNHVMEESHYIEWIGILDETEERYIYLKPGEKATVLFEKKTSGTLYAYCNKHGLWKKEIC